MPVTSGTIAGRQAPTSSFQLPASSFQLPASSFQPASNPPQLVLDTVSFSYPDGTPALRDLSLTVRAGEFVALLGPNGSGKTTLAKHLNGLLKPARGRVLVDGRDTRPARVAELARTVGYVFQSPDHQIFAPTVGEEIAFGLRLQGAPPSTVAQLVVEALSPFGLASQLDLPPALLGWGERRQIALAAVLATRPQVLILDEPTGGLDARSKQNLMAVVAAYNRQGRTVILITHDVRLVAEYAGRAVVMAGGRVAFDGAPAALFERRDVLAQARLALPPVVRLAQRLVRYGLAPGVLTCADFAAAWQALAERPLSLSGGRFDGSLDNPRTSLSARAPGTSGSVDTTAATTLRDWKSPPQTEKPPQGLGWSAAEAASHFQTATSSRRPGSPPWQQTRQTTH